MFNQFVWETYLKAGGSEIVAFFHNNLSGKLCAEYPKHIQAMVSRFCPMKTRLDELEKNLNDYISILQKETVEFISQK